MELLHHCDVVVQLQCPLPALGVSGVYKLLPDQDLGKLIVTAYLDFPACLTTYLPSSPPSQICHGPHCIIYYDSVVTNAQWVDNRYPRPAR